MRITQPQVEVVGVYKVRVDAQLMKEAMAAKFPSDLAPEERRRAESAVFEEISSAVLIELILSNADERYNADDFGQPLCDQVAYHETYLSEDGRSVISEHERPTGDFVRVVFFLHFFDPRKPLNTSYGQVTVPSAIEMPERLKNIIRYVPVD